MDFSYLEKGLLLYRKGFDRSGKRYGAQEKGMTLQEKGMTRRHSKMA